MYGTDLSLVEFIAGSVLVVVLLCTALATVGEFMDWLTARTRQQPMGCFWRWVLPAGLVAIVVVMFLVAG